MSLVNLFILVTNILFTYTRTDSGVLLTGWKKKQVSLCLSRLCFSWVLCLPIPTPKWRDSCGGLWVNCSLKRLLFYLISVKASKLIQVDWVKALDSGYAGHLMALAVLFRSFSTALQTSQGSPFVDYMERINQNESPLLCEYYYESVIMHLIWLQLSIVH